MIAEWSEKVPEKPGWYLARLKNLPGCILTVKLVEKTVIDAVSVDGTSLVKLDNFNWFGPVKIEPEFPLKENP